MMGLSALQVARDVATDLGLDVDDDFLDYVLWNHTGFPIFWRGNPIECCARQVDEYLRGIYRCARCGKVLPDGTGADMEVCPGCSWLLDYGEGGAGE